MKYILTLLAASLLQSCQHASGAGWKITSVGTNVEGLDISPERMRVATQNQSEAFKDATATVRAMWNAYISLQGIKFITGKYYDYKGDELASSTSVELEKLKNAASVNEANAQVKLLKQQQAVITP